MNQMRNWLLILQAFCAVIIIASRVACGTAIAEDKDELMEIWRKKVPEGTKSYSNWSKSHLKSRSSTTSAAIVLPGEGKPQPVKIQMRSVMKRNGSFYIYSSEAITPNPMVSNDCYGINSKYAFALKKSKNGRDWVIKNVVFEKPEFAEKALGGSMTISTDSGVVHGFRAIVDRAFEQGLLIRLISGRSIEPWKIEELPGFRLQSISAEGPRQNILHVSFDYQVEDSERKKTGVAKCEMDFDLESNCYPVKSHQILKNGDEITTLDWTKTMRKLSEKEYEEKSTTRLKKTLNAVVTPLEETESEEHLSLDAPEKDFTLSAFGLPEPPGIEWEKPFPWYLVFAGIGTACLGFFFFLRARGRRLRGS